MAENFSQIGMEIAKGDTNFSKKFVDSTVGDSSRDMGLAAEAMRNSVNSRSLRGALPTPNEVSNSPELMLNLAKDKELTPKEAIKNDFNARIETSIRGFKYRNEQHKQMVEEGWAALSEAAEKNFQVGSVHEARAIALDVQRTESQVGATKVELVKGLKYIESFEDEPIAKLFGVKEEMHKLEEAMDKLPPQYGSKIEMAYGYDPDITALVDTISSKAMDKTAKLNSGIFSRFGLVKEFGLGMTKDSKELHDSAKEIFGLAAAASVAKAKFDGAVADSHVDVAKSNQFLNDYDSLKSDWLQVKKNESQNSQLEAAKNVVAAEYDANWNAKIAKAESDAYDMKDAEDKKFYDKTGRTERSTGWDEAHDLSKRDELIAGAREEDRQAREMRANIKLLFEVMEKAGEVNLKQSKSEQMVKTIENESREFKYYSTESKRLALRNLAAMNTIAQNDKAREQFVADIASKKLPDTLSKILTIDSVGEIDKLIKTGKTENIGAISEVLTQIEDLIKESDGGTRFYEVASGNIGGTEQTVGMTVGKATEGNLDYWEIKTAHKDAGGNVRADIDGPVIRIKGAEAKRIIGDIQNYQAEISRLSMEMDKSLDDYGVANSEQAKASHETKMHRANDTMKALNGLIDSKYGNLAAELSQMSGDSTMKTILRDMQADNMKVADDLFGRHFAETVDGLAGELGIPAEMMTAEVLASIYVAADNAGDAAKDIYTWIDSSDMQQEMLLRRDDVLTEMKSIAFINTTFDQVQGQIDNAPDEKSRKALESILTQVRKRMDAATAKLSTLISTELTNQVPAILRTNGAEKTALSRVEFEKRVDEVMNRYGFDRKVPEVPFGIPPTGSTLVRSQLNFESRVDAMASNLMDNISHVHESGIAGSLRNALNGGDRTEIMEAVKSGIQASGEELQVEALDRAKSELADGKVWKERTYQSQDTMFENAEFLVNGGVDDIDGLLADMAAETEPTAIANRTKLVQLFELSINRIALMTPDEIAVTVSKVDHTLKVANFAMQQALLAFRNSPGKVGFIQAHYARMMKPLEAALAIQQKKKTN